MSPVPDHHHHPLSDVPCHNISHDPATGDPRHRHVFAAVYVDAMGLMTMTPWANIDAAQQIADERRGVVVAFPVIVDFSTGVSMVASGSWPAAKQTTAELERAQDEHAARQERERQLHRERDPLDVDPPAASGPVCPACGGPFYGCGCTGMPKPKPKFAGFFAPPAGFIAPAHQRPASDYDDEQQYTTRVRPPFSYDPDDGAGVPITITEVPREVQR